MPIVRAMSAPYVPLRVFSSFTMLEGAIEPKAIAKQAKKLGFPAIALNDRNGLYAAMPFGEACIAEGVQPIIGAMLAVARPDDVGPAGTIDWLVLLAQDETATTISAGWFLPPTSTARSTRSRTSPSMPFKGRVKG